VLSQGDSRVAGPADGPGAASGVAGHTRTFTVADNSVVGGLRTRVSGVFQVAPNARQSATPPSR